MYFKGVLFLKNSIITFLSSSSSSSSFTISSIIIFSLLQQLRATPHRKQCCRYSCSCAARGLIFIISNLAEKVWFFCKDFMLFKLICSRKRKNYMELRFEVPVIVQWAFLWMDQCIHSMRNLFENEVRR
ncbi:hypothetical protein P8452_18365 [Trifolium repens]|nr:hypothetical protein P8452_18365 [Trifolium repens]